MCKNPRSLVQPTLHAPLQNAIDGLGKTHKESFRFLVSAIDVKLLHGVLLLQMGYYKLH